MEQLVPLAAGVLVCRWDALGWNAVCTVRRARRGALEYGGEGVRLRRLPAGLRAVSPALTRLDVSGCGLRALAPAGALAVLAPTLEALVAQRNALEALPGAALAAFERLQTLDVANNRIRHVPPELGDVRSLTALNLMGNQLEGVPPELGKLSNLVVLGLKSNAIESLPDELGGLTSLVHLFLTDNKLAELPAGLASCVRLRKIQAARNRIERLPAELAGLPELEFVRLACNRLASVPPALAAPRVAWVGLAGCPVADERVKIRELREVEAGCPGLRLTGESLGALQGASGELEWAELDGERVVLKWYRTGDPAYVSPDGKPEDELAVASYLRHPRLVEAVAVVRGDAGRVGLAMRPAAGAPLGKPHNFGSVLRCPWPEGWTCRPRWATQCFADVAAALAYMHGEGVAMADVFAHNVLVEADTGRATLCDFGAAFFYDREAAAAAGVDFERQEVRALGLLIADCAARGGGDLLASLGARCVSDDAASRPSFDELARELLEALSAGEDEPSA